MDVRFNYLSQQIFNKPLQECSEHEIRSFVEQHPSFSPAQFLLLKKLDKSSEAYQAQFQKAILYYHDPVAFDFLINGEDYDTDIEEKGIKNIEQGTGKIEHEIGNIEHDYQGKILEEKSNPISSLSSISNEQKTSPPEPVRLGKEEQGYRDNLQEEKKELQVFNEETPVPTEELTFEPFHTVDYFASLGIKLSKEEATKDRMGMQLKSFTEWLKTMKRLQMPELEKKLGANSQQKVENMATDSVQNADVFTEAMAEVWIKQGNVTKAMEVYNNLCLQNPSKSAYFAAKIDHLKEQI